MGIPAFVFLLLMGMTSVRSTCVLETDFGLSINCGLKKSGMFRVRNLGGLKGYVGVGLQLADELGFKESLSALEQNNKRRSVNGFPAPGSFEPLGVPQNNNRVTTAGAPVDNGVDQDRSAYAKMNGRTTTVPPFRPLMAAANNMVRNVRFAAQQQQQQQQHKQQQQQPLLKPLPVPAFAALPESIAKVSVEKPQTPAPAAPAVPVQIVRPAMTQMAALTSFQRPAAASPNLQLVQLSAMVPQMQLANRRFNGFAQIPADPTGVRPIIVTPVAVVDNRKAYGADANSPLSNEVDPAPPSTGSLAAAAAANNVTVEQLAAAIRQRHRGPPTTPPPTAPPGPMMMLVNAAAANNVSVEQLAMVLRHQQQQRPFYAAPAATTTATAATTTATTTTTTTAPPPPAIDVEEPLPPATKKIAIKPYKSKYGGNHKVMNAPKEYYPVGYDKNFDDNFVSKVDLPDTSFNCGEQKHFPGLYGDEDLGCMVFHVCAFTDDGLTQKSFLCPESTLFDQTILKCNWWFYVDCKSSEKLYDSNIPISKSYQLMKALTFFSSYSAGPSVDASVAAATAAISPGSDGPASSADPPAKSADVGSTVGWSALSAGPVSSASPEPTSYLASTTETFDSVSFRR